MRIVVRWLRVLAARLGRVLVAVGAQGDDGGRGQRSAAAGTDAATAGRPVPGAGRGAAAGDARDGAGTGPPAHWLADIAAHDPSLADPADPRWQGAAAPRRREPPAPVVAPRQTRPAGAQPQRQRRPRARPRRRTSTTGARRRPLAADDPDPSPAGEDTRPVVGALRRLVAAAHAAGRAAATAWRTPTAGSGSRDLPDRDPATRGTPSPPPTDPDLPSADEAPERVEGITVASDEHPAPVDRRASVADLGPAWSPPHDRVATRHPSPRVTWEDQPAASHPLPAWPDLPDERGTSTATGVDDAGTAWPSTRAHGDDPRATRPGAPPATLGPWPLLPDRPGAVRLPGHQLDDRWRYEQERR